MPTDDYDTPWKDAVTRYFPEFMAFYFPQAHAAIDWACPHPSLTQQTGKAPQRRQQQKQRLVKLLLCRNWERQAIMDLLFVLDWIMRLPAELEAELWRDVKKQEGVAIMPYMLSIERIIRKESRKQGRQEGRQEGRKNGLEEGLQKGQATLLAALLTKRFGPLPPETARRLAGADAAQLTAWAEALLDAASLEEVFRPH